MVGKGPGAFGDYRTEEEKMKERGGWGLPFTRGAKSGGCRAWLSATAVVCLSGLLIAGCGYTTRSMISSQYRTIYIAAFTNQINIANEESIVDKYRVNRPYIETDVTKAVTNRYLFDGNIKPVKTQDADLTLKSDIVDFRRDPLRYTNNDDVEEYRINVVVNMTMTDNKAEKVLWAENGFTGTATYFTTGAMARSEVAAVNEAIEDLARRIVERTVEEW
jgi:hypothetical protein